MYRIHLNKTILFFKLLYCKFILKIIKYDFRKLNQFVSIKYFIKVFFIVEFKHMYLDNTDLVYFIVSFLSSAQSFIYIIKYVHKFHLTWTENDFSNLYGILKNSFMV